MKYDQLATLVGCFIALAYTTVAFAQNDGFDCVISNGVSCRACSGCFYDEFQQLQCGTVEKSAYCSGNERAECSVETDDQGNSTYSATCKEKSFTPIGGPGGVH